MPTPITPQQPRKRGGIITVRMPVELQDALIREAREQCVSMNELCKTKLTRKWGAELAGAPKLIEGTKRI